MKPASNPPGSMQEPRPSASNGTSSPADSPTDGYASDPDGLAVRRSSDGAAISVIPDCCNLGIAARLLVLLNLGALLIVLLSVTNLAEIGFRLLSVLAVLEPLALVALATLCGVRRLVIGQRDEIQWIAGLAVPFVLTFVSCAISIRFLGPDLQALAWWAWVLIRCFAAIAISALLFEFFRLRTLSFAPSLTEARLQALQARIRPHFLFNSLNTVLGLMRGDPRRAEHTLENLADLFRVFMRDTRELVPLDEEAVTCQQYIAIEELRLGDRLRVEWHLEDMPGDALLPSLLLQPLIENAVHHGIEPRTEPGLVSVRIERAGERVRVEILNPMSDQPPVRAGNQMALSNIKERLMLLYDIEAELKTDTLDGQFRVVLVFPYRKERRRRDVRRHFNPYR